MEKIDQIIVNLLATGMTQKEVAEHFKSKNILPSSVSIIEKRMKKIKKNFHAKTSIQLGVTLVRLGYIYKSPGRALKMRP